MGVAILLPAVLLLGPSAVDDAVLTTVLALFVIVLPLFAGIFSGGWLLERVAGKGVWLSPGKVALACAAIAAAAWWALLYMRWHETNAGPFRVSLQGQIQQSGSGPIMLRLSMECVLVCTVAALMGYTCSREGRDSAL